MNYGDARADRILINSSVSRLKKFRDTRISHSYFNILYITVNRPIHFIYIYIYIYIRNLKKNINIVNIIYENVLTWNCVRGCHCSKKNELYSLLFHFFFKKNCFYSYFTTDILCFYIIYCTRNLTIIYIYIYIQNSINSLLEW